MTKEELFKQIVTELKNLPTDEKIEKLTTNLEDMYGVPKAVSLSMIVREHNKRFFDSTDIRLIILFIMEAMKVLGRGELIEQFIPIAEQLESKQYDFKAVLESKKRKLPITLTPAIKVNEMYSTPMKASEIAELLDSGIVNYNFDIQREAKLEIRTGEVIKKPTINQTNVKEMTQHLLNETLKESTIYLNAAPMTSKSGDELQYNANDYSLVITEGTRLDVLDGFHRILATQSASRINPDLDFEFNVMFSNFTTAEAIKWQTQHSKATAWSKNRVIEMQQESKGSKIAKGIKEYDTELETQIHTGGTVFKPTTSTITFANLTKTIDELYEVETRRDEVVIIEELSKVLLSILELKKAYKKQVSQVFVMALIKFFVHEFNRDLAKFDEFILKLVSLMEEDKIEFVKSEENKIYETLIKVKEGK